MAVTAWKYPTSAAATSMSGDGVASWVNPENIGADDSVDATTSLTNTTNQSRVLRAYGFGFAADIPAGSIIVGVEVDIQRSAGTASRICDLSLYLVTDGTASSPASRVGSNRASAAGYTTSMTNETHGGAADLWDAALTAAIVRDPNFGLHFQAQYYSGTAGSVTARFDYIAMRITYIPPAQGTGAIVEGADVATAAGTVRAQGAAAITETSDNVASTPGYAPILDLNFLDGIIPATVTVSGGANGTRVDSAGVIVAATCPRFDYDPVSLEPRGLLIEEQRTNLLLRSAEFDNAAWNKTNYPVTVTANASTAPDGTASADRLTPTAANDRHAISQGIAASAGATYTVSYFVKAAGNTRYVAIGDSGDAGWHIVTADLTNGTIVSNNNATGTVEAFANGEYRIKCTYTRTNAGTNLIFAGAVPTGTNSALPGYDDVTLLLDVWGAQFEAGAFATSYIPTTSAAVTRSADSASITGASFSSFYNQTEGALIVEYLLPFISGNRMPAYLRNGGDTNFIATFIETATPKSYIWNATQQAGMANAAIAAGVVHRSGLAYRQDDFAGVTDGGSVGTDTSGSVPNDLSRMDIGRANAVSYLNGHIRRLRYHNQRLPNAVLQALTKTITGAGAIAEANDNVAATGRVKVTGQAAIVEGGDVAAGAGETGVPLHTPSGRTATVGASRLANRTAR